MLQSLPWTRIFEIALWNRFTETLAGFSIEDTLGKVLVESSIEPEAKERVRQVLVDALSGQEASHYQSPLHTKDRKKVEILNQ